MFTNILIKNGHDWVINLDEQFKIKFYRLVKRNFSTFEII